MQYTKQYYKYYYLIIWHVDVLRFSYINFQPWNLCFLLAFFSSSLSTLPTTCPGVSEGRLELQQPFRCPPPAPRWWQPANATAGSAAFSASQLQRAAAEIHRHFIHHSGRDAVLPVTTPPQASEDITCSHLSRPPAPGFSLLGHAGPVCEGSDRVLSAESQQDHPGPRSHHGRPLLAAKWHLAGAVLVIHRWVPGCVSN